MSLPRYAEYKDGGAPWLGEVPKQWQIAPFKRLVEFQNGSDHKAVQVDDGYPVYGSGGVFAYASNYLNDGESVLLGRKGTVDKPLYVTGKFWTVDTMYWTRIAPDAYGKFCYYAATAIPFAYYSTNTALPSMTQSALGAHLMTFPEREEQIEIANFLDRETGKIDALIAEQEKLLTLLAEKRQATISHAVTHGLNPNAPMKDSGVPWLGEVPAHWDVVPLMHLTDPGRPIMYGIVLPGPDVEGGIPIVKGGDVRLHKLKVDLLNRTTIELEASYARARLRPLDIVYSIRGTIGDAEVVPDELLDANITQDVARISPAAGIQTRWLLYAMKSKPVFVQLEQRSLGAAVRGINIFELKRARIPVPPIGERDAIAAFLDKELEKLDLLTFSASEAITLFKERRSALIAAVVTGKIDVRGNV